MGQNLDNSSAGKAILSTRSGGLGLRFHGARTVWVRLRPCVCGPNLRDRHAAKESREAKDGAILPVGRVEAVWQTAHALLGLSKVWGLSLGLRA